jgi:hypothetical protein
MLSSVKRYEIEKVLRDIPTFSTFPGWVGKRVILCESLASYVGFCDPSKHVVEPFCRNVGISRKSCTFPSQKSDDSTPPMPNFHASWITPKSRPLLTGYYTTWQSLADFVEILQSPSISATFRHRSSLTTPNYGVICRRLWYYQDFKVHFVRLRRMPFFGI